MKQEGSWFDLDCVDVERMDLLKQWFHGGFGRTSFGFEPKQKETHSLGNGSPYDKGYQKKGDPLLIQGETRRKQRCPQNARQMILFCNPPGTLHSLLAKKTPRASHLSMKKMKYYKNTCFYALWWRLMKNLLQITVLGEILNIQLAKCPFTWLQMIVATVEAKVSWFVTCSTHSFLRLRLS